MLLNFTYGGVKYAEFDYKTAEKAGVPVEFLNDVVSDHQWKDIRSTRDNLIAETDWTQTGDAPIPDDKKAEFAAYRQALRDIPQTYSNPEDVVWPAKPTL